MPTRLVRVRTLGHGASYRIAATVCETKDLSSDVAVRYTTLSHRWGDSGKMLKLERSNIDTFRREIPMGQLLNLLKDALYMTCQLDIYYIWIDCLCIIQGCKRDWEVEAKRMGDYYRYAPCNLSATGNDDSSIGIFGKRIPLSYLHYPIQMDFVLVSKEAGREVRAHYEGFFIKADCFDFRNDVMNAVLGSRGWVAQECALSPAILHFTPRQTWWECNKHIFNEAFPGIDLPWSFARTVGIGAARSVDQKNSIDHIYSAWHAFVAHYAATDLTYDTDRFPAVIGIANIYNTLLEDNLIAGMWEGDLLRSLLWQPKRKANKLPSARIAPSWSWAPLAVAHIYPPPGFPITGICFRVLWENPDFHSDLQNKACEKSSVRGLAVTGPLRRLSVRLEDLPYWSRFATRGQIRLDVEDASHFSGQDIAGHEWRWEDHTHFLPLWKCYASSDTEIWAIALLLQQAPIVERQGTFRRLGIVELEFPSEKLCDRYLGLVKENGRYQSSVGFGDYGLQEFAIV